MSYARKIEDARRHLRKCRADAEEAHCLANQTGKAADRQRLMEAMRAEQEAEEALDAELEIAQGGVE